MPDGKAWLGAGTEAFVVVKAGEANGAGRVLGKEYFSEGGPLQRDNHLQQLEDGDSPLIRLAMIRHLVAISEGYQMGRSSRAFHSSPKSAYATSFHK